MGIRNWWRELHGEQKATLYIVVLVATLLVLVALFSGCFATVEYVKLEDARQEAIVKKFMWTAFAHMEAQRQKVNPEDKAAPQLRTMALSNAADIDVPPPTAITAGYMEMVGWAGTVLAALGLPALGVKLKRTGTKWAESEQKRQRERKVLRKVRAAAGTAGVVAEPADLTEADDVLNGGA